jgi:hypothetical protein
VVVVGVDRFQMRKSGPYHECSVQDVMIENLQRQVAELNHCLTVQNMEMHCDIDDCNPKSNFENSYHNFVLVREQCVRDERHGELGFKVELPEFSSTLTALTVVSKFQVYLPNPSHVEDEDEIIEEYFSVDWVPPPIYDIYPDENDLLEEINLFLDTIKIIEENDVHFVFDESPKRVKIY